MVMVLKLLCIALLGCFLDLTQYRTTCQISPGFHHEMSQGIVQAAVEKFSVAGQISKLTVTAILMDLNLF